MIEGLHPLVQALLGGLFTWGLTAAGAATVFVWGAQNKKMLDASLGFAAGVMTAASFWSLLAPGIERAEQTLGKWAFAPISVGFFFGALFVYGCDALLPFLGFSTDEMVTAFLATGERRDRSASSQRSPSHTVRAQTDGTVLLNELRSGDTTNSDTETKCAAQGDESLHSGSVQLSPTHTQVGASHQPRRRFKQQVEVPPAQSDVPRQQLVNSSAHEEAHAKALTWCQSQTMSGTAIWRRVFLLIVAIVVHNVPEGLAVGIAFGAIGAAPTATFQAALGLAIGIGIQNFPEGMAVSLPLVGFGYSKLRAFFYGQLSGMVEPLAAVAGCAIVTLMEPVLPYALSFAAGAMIYVVFDDIVPEAQVHGNAKLASWAAIGGFIVMMSLDVSLG